MSRRFGARASRSWVGKEEHCRSIGVRGRKPKLQCRITVSLVVWRYAEQRGTVVTDKESDPFELKEAQSRDPLEQLTVKNGAAIFIGRRPQKMAGVEQRHSFGCPKRRLPHQSAFRR